MSRYPNGCIPESELVRFDDHPDHLLPPGTARKLAALIRLVRDRHGVTLYVTEGTNGYRDYSTQVRVRAEKCAIGRCNDAAWPGTSPHGGEVDGEDVAAFDIDNWAVIGRDAFFQACRDVGLEPGTVSWEAWHVIDRDPWAAVPAGEEEDDMSAAADQILARLDDIEERLAQISVQPIPARVIRNVASGDLALLHPGGVAIIGDPLIPDIATANGMAMMAGQQLRDDGGYWIDLPGDRFGWEIDRHKKLLDAITTS